MTPDFSKIPMDVLLRLAKEVMGPPRRTLAGTELEHTKLLLLMMEPTSASNNQRGYTEVYHLGGREYHWSTWHNEFQIEVIENA